MKTKTINQVVEFKASTNEVYEALMDSKKHSEFTGDSAEISREIWGKFSAYGGGLNGTNIELVQDKKIVQKWKCEMEGWPEDHYSIVTFLLEKIKDGTKLTFTQVDVPEKCYEEISEGWEEYYWKRLRKMFEKK